MEEDLRDFFPLPRVVNSIFGLIQTQFDITITEVKDPEEVKVWNKDVKLFQVTDNDTCEALGHFFFDPYMR